MADDSFKHQVLEATDIVELVSQTVALKRRGAKYIGLCPFHQEKTPSFNVDPVKKFFKCFGCKEGGNAIDFVIKRDRVDFLDALKSLAERAGLELPKYGISKQKTGEKQLLLDIHAKAADFYHRNLLHPTLGKPARDYLISRGFNDETVRNFKIGYAPPGWDNLLRSRDLMGAAPGLMALGGLLKARDGGSGGGHYDTFRNRLMFPIRDEQGRTVAFGGRVMPGSDDPAKYLNSPETPLFTKSRTVFGLDLARPRIVETRSVAICEGYTDVAAAHQFGVTNVVSPLGTALTEQHVGILRRFADRIVFLFDADAAGEMAVNRAVELFLTQPVEIAIATIPEDLDPDEYLIKYGKAAFDDLLKNAEDALNFKWKLLKREYDEADGSLTGQQKAVESYLSLISGARNTGPVDPLRWGATLRRVEGLTGIPMAQLTERFGGRSNPVQARPAASYGGRPNSPASSSGPFVPVGQNDVNLAPGKAVPEAKLKAERWILGILLAEPSRWVHVQMQVSPDNFEGPLHRRLAEFFWGRLRDEGEVPFHELLSELPDEEIKRLSIDLAEDSEKLPDVEATLQGALAYFGEVAERQREAKNFAGARSKETNEEDQLAALKALMNARRTPDIRRGT